MYRVVISSILFYMNSTDELNDMAFKNITDMLRVKLRYISLLIKKLV